MSSSSLADFLLDAMKDRQAAEKSAILPEAAIMRLREFAENYGKKPFKVGDLVTPRKGTKISGAGNVCIVVDLGSDEPQFVGGATPGDAAFGNIANIRVAKFSGGNVVAYWCEAHEFEPYTGAADAYTPPHSDRVQIDNGDAGT